MKPIQLLSPKSSQRPNFSILPPLGLYIHLPWCVRRCPYCDFNAHVAPEVIPEDDFFRALQIDLEQALPDIWGRSIISVFFGGGTPSLMSAAFIDRVISMVRAYLPLAQGAEITLEANPGASEAGRFADYAQAGVNRLSIGVQSFNDDVLQKIGRIHDAHQAQQAIYAALAAVDRVNIDLMYALPGQSVEDCLKGVHRAIDSGATHLSIYQLMLEPNTVFAKYPPELPREEDSAAMHDQIIDTVTDIGFEHYEVSAFAKHKHYGAHNMNYWSFGDYLGIGPGAHSKISFPHSITRMARTRNPQVWMQQALQGQGKQVSERYEVKATELPFEFMLNVLRLKDGVPYEYFTARAGLGGQWISKAIQQAVDKGLMEDRFDRICATELGWRFLTDLQTLFLSTQES
ncbi:MAG TPA: radical SAM family heme chaperone HemW [Paenalcaligenes sp.]|nr:radical SAM family heme chaperone HemW [Paenalcaligenes sp.]